MGLPSLFENIQDRRDDAEHFRQVGPVTVDQIAMEATPPVVDAVEVAPVPVEDPATVRRRRNLRRRNWLGRGQFEYTRDTVIWRGGAQRYTEKIMDVFFRAFDRGGSDRALQVDFKIASKGGGETHLSARIGPRDFQPLIQAMIVADRQAVLEAMAEELAHHRH